VITIYNTVTGETREVWPPTARYVIERQPDWTTQAPEHHEPQEPYTPPPPVYAVEHDPFGGMPDEGLQNDMTEHVPPAEKRKRGRPKKRGHGGA